jgi:protein-L-isoaspartate(D-aspartate) O-methyltransferase
VAFERAGDHLVSQEHEMCGFVPMQGAGARSERLVLLHGEDVGLRVDDGQETDDDGLRASLSGPRTQAWTGVRFGGMEPFDGLYLWLATWLDGFGLLTRKRTDAAREVADPSSSIGTPTLIDGPSFAYHAFRKLDDGTDSYEFGVYGHGPDASRLADQMAALIRDWDRGHRTASAQIAAYPAGTPDDQLPAGRVIGKRHTRITISWP